MMSFEIFSSSEESESDSEADSRSNHILLNFFFAVGIVSHSIRFFFFHGADVASSGSFVRSPLGSVSVSTISLLGYTQQV